MQNGNIEKTASTKLYNTTEDSDSIPRHITLLLTQSSNDYLEYMAYYSAATNKLNSTDWYMQVINNTNSELMVKSETKNWFSHKPDSQAVRQFKLSRLHSFLTLFFSNPLAFGSSPFVDMLYLTIDVNEDELKALKASHLKQLPECLNLIKQGKAEVLANYKDVYQRFAMLSFGRDDKILLLWGLHPEVAAKRSDQNLLKITLNPARHTESELQALFRWLKKAIGKNAKRKLLNSNVTRLDIALDIVGLHLPELLVDQTACTEYDYFLNESADEEVVGTQRIGSPQTSHLRAYNKLQKLIDEGPRDIPLLSFKEVPFQPIQISRLERVRKPHDSGGLKLIQLVYGLPYFLKGTKVYCPRLLLKLTEEQQKLVRKYGFMYWYTNHNGASVISVQELQAHEILINHSLLELAQKQALKHLKKLILG